MAKKAKKRVSKAKRPKYACEACGLMVTVDEACGCVEECDIVCCGESMKVKK